MSSKDRYNQIIRAVFELREYEEIDEMMTRENTPKWDSLLHLTFVVAIEDEFGIILDTDNILNLNSYDAGLDIIKKMILEN